MSKSIGDSNLKSPDFNPMDPNNSPPSPQQPTTNPSIIPSSNKSPLQEEELAEERQQSELQNLQQPQLRRISSVSAAASRVKKRALSFSTMRRSSSVSDRYCRIHDQSEFLADDDDHHHDHIDVDGDGYGKVGSMAENAAAYRGSSRSDHKKKLISRSRIIRACKKILGL
ncbi:unnamed protein product [Linum trigynum]